LRKLFLLQLVLFSKLCQVLLLLVSLSTIVSDREMLGRRPLFPYGHFDMVGVVRLRIKSYGSEPSRGKGVLLGTQSTLVALSREFLD
jgi:hypothetical protein